MIGKAGRTGDGILTSPRVVMATVIAAGILLRAPGLFTDFWLDEIWSLSMAQAARTPLEIFTSLRHDNNHHLNTLWIWLAGAQADWVVYRLFPFASGIAVMLLLPMLGRDERERVVLAVLGAFAAMPVVYSTEARGYMPAAALALGAVVLSYGGRPARFPTGVRPVGDDVRAGYPADRGRHARRTLLAGLLISLAMLAHMTAVFAYAGLLVQKRKHWPLMHALPLATLAYLGWMSRTMTVGGGVPMSRTEAALMAARWTGGIVVVAIALFELVKRDDRLFFAITVFLAPLATVTAFPIPHNHPRYFFLASVFALPLLASFIVRLRVYGVALLLAWLIMMGVQLAPFLRDGRGHYYDALELMARQSGGTARISGAYHFGNARMVSFYAPYLPEGLRVEYVNDPADAEWFVGHSFIPDAETPTLPGYREVQRFRHGGFSGWTWMVYRRIP
jgi:hypothetical protein